MRILITGSRHWQDLHTVRFVLRELQGLEPVFTIVHGGARGADYQAAQAARELGLRQEVYEPAYERYALPDRWQAPLDRNLRMLESGVDLVIAFRGEGKSKGTDYTVREARKRQIPVRVVTGWPGGVR